MKADNRSLPDWFNEIRSGRLRLPRFQRFESWGHKNVEELLQTVLRGLPTGALLVLRVGDEERFISRKLVGAPEPRERCIEHLLDGQQRLTALWRSFHDHYEDRTYFVKQVAPDDPEADGLEGILGDQVPIVHGIPRWDHNGRRFPLWVDDPVQVWERGYIPLRLLRPGEEALMEVKAWAQVACGREQVRIDELEIRISKLRERVLMYTIPFLSLPPSTPPSVALDVFVKMNTSMVALGDFDVVVAQFEAKTGQSLHQLIDDLVAAVQNIRDYVWCENFVLSVACLREDRAPTRASVFRLDLGRIGAEWSNIVAGIRWAVSWMEEECIWDETRLPSAIPLQVLAALHPHVPKALDALGDARRIIRKYLWRSFLTHRYDQSAGTYALQDLRGLVKALDQHADESEIPAFGDAYTLPTIEEIKNAGWPSKRDTLARALLAITIKAGGFDIADGEKATAQHVRRREYHHLFPDFLLTTEGRLTRGESYKALNCALITWNTNRTISAKEPLRYLQERVQRSALGEQAIRNRLRSHLVPYDALATGGYSDIADPEDRARHIQADYHAFLDARAREFMEPIRLLADGQNWPQETGWPP